MMETNISKKAAARGSKVANISKARSGPKKSETTSSIVINRLKQALQTYTLEPDERDKILKQAQRLPQLNNMNMPLLAACFVFLRQIKQSPTVVDFGVIVTKDYLPKLVPIPSENKKITPDEMADIRKNIKASMFRYCECIQTRISEYEFDRPYLGMTAEEIEALKNESYNQQRSGSISNSNA